MSEPGTTPSDTSDRPRRSSRLARWNPWQGIGALPKPIWVLFATVLVNRVGTMVLPFLTLYLTQRRGFDPGRAGLVLTFYGLGVIVAAPLAGRLADRFGPLLVMRTSLFLSAAVLMVFPWATTWAGVLTGAVLLAVVTEAYRPASMAIVVDLVRPDQRKAAYAVNRLAVNLGMSIGPALGGFIVEYSFDGLFWVDGATTLAAGIVLASFALTPPAVTAATGGSGVEPASVQPACPATTPAHRDGSYLAFLTASALAAAVFFQHEGALPLHLVLDLGFAPSFFGLLFTLNTVLIVILEVRLNFATAAWSHGRTLLIGAILLGLGFGALAFARGAWVVAATVVVWTFGEMMLLPAMSNFVADVAPPGRRGEYMGLYTMSWGIAFGFGPWAGTEVLHRLGSRPLWIGTLAVSVLAGGIMLGAARARRRAVDGAAANALPESEAP